MGNKDRISLCDMTWQSSLLSFSKKQLFSLRRVWSLGAWLIGSLIHLASDCLLGDSVKFLAFDRKDFQWKWIYLMEIKFVKDKLGNTQGVVRNMFWKRTCKRDYKTITFPKGNINNLFFVCFGSRVYHLDQWLWTVDSTTTTSHG